MSSQDNLTDDTTDFGYERVKTAEKAGRVREVFDSVAAQYDLMNDLMSGGLHRLWKRFTIELSAVRSGQTVLDIAVVRATSLQSSQNLWVPMAKLSWQILTPPCCPSAAIALSTRVR